MKRIFATTALTAVLATGAFAQTEGRIAELERFLPNVNVEMLDDQTIDTLVSIAHGDGTFGERQQRMEALINDSGIGGGTVTATFTEAQLVEVRAVAPDVDIASMTDAQILQALSIIRSDDRSDAATKIRAIVESDDESMLMLTDDEIREIRLVAPDFDFTTVTEEQAAELRAAVATGERDQIDATVRRIEAM